MITINNLTLRLGGRAILEGASAAIPLDARIGLIGRNGAGKSTLMKALIGEIEPDEGEIAKPSRARIGYIAQEAPSGTATPFDTVLAADTERAALMAESETTEDPDRLGHIYERLTAIDRRLIRDMDTARLVSASDGERSGDEGPACHVWRSRAALPPPIVTDTGTRVSGAVASHRAVATVMWSLVTPPHTMIYWIVCTARLYDFTLNHSSSSLPSPSVLGGAAPVATAGCGFFLEAHTSNRVSCFVGTRSGPGHFSPTA